jgi:hypothetical protein
MPATWETLRAVLVGEGKKLTMWEMLRTMLVGKDKKKQCRDERALDATLTELEDRGLVGWD